MAPYGTGRGKRSGAINPYQVLFLIVDCVLVLLTWIAVGVRVLARRISGAGIGWDDYLILPALPGGFGMLVMQGMYSKLGVGYPLTEALHNLPIILRASTYQSSASGLILIGYVLTFAFTALLIQLSVLAFYLRIFVTPATHLASKMVMVWVLLWSVGNILQVFLICKPYAVSYDPGVTGTCRSQKASFIAIGSFNAVTDVAILALTVRTISSLHTRRGTRVGLLGVFGIGLLTNVVSMNSLDLATNLTGTMIYADFLSAFEVNLGILCVSLPVLGPVYARYFRRGATTNGSTGKSYGPGSSGALRMFGAGKQSKHERLEDVTVCDGSPIGRGKEGSDEGSGSDIELVAADNDMGNGIQAEREWVMQVIPEERR